MQNDISLAVDISSLSRDFELEFQSRKFILKCKCKKSFEF